MTEGRPQPAAPDEPDRGLATAAESGEPKADDGDRRPTRDRARLRATALVLGGLAAVAVLTNTWGRYVGDNRFEQYFNPARRIVRSFTTWDGSRGLGRVREDFWPGATVPVALLRGLGLEPWLAEHVWHGLLLAAGGLGAVMVLRAFRPRVGTEHLLAGLLYAFGAYSATFLIPSNLYLTYAICPWLVLMTLEGLRAPRPACWGWAAGFALLVFAAGNTDPPGILFCGLPVLAAGLYLVVVERSVSWGRALRWAGAAAALSFGVSAAALAKVWISSATFAQRLGDTELPEVTNIASSWSESWRGQGFWLSYFRERGTLSRPQGERYFTSAVVVAATFVPPVVALATLWLSRWRARLLFAGMALLALIVMVGAFPTADPFPFGEAVLSAYERITLLSAFRGAYKAGSGLALGVAVLFGVGVAAAAARAKARWRPLGPAVVLSAVLVVAVAGAPFWTGGLYDPSKDLDEVPGYWTDALAFLDDQEADGRVLVLPSSTRTRYRWGWTGDDIFDAMLGRDHAIDTAIPLSNPEAADLLAAMSDRIADGTYTQGSLPDAARRLGIDYVVVRNDLDWQAMRRPRPAALAQLRADPGLRFVRAFGANGENTTSPNDDSEAATGERNLPPVEVYAVRQPQPGLEAEPIRPPVLVSGDGEAWAALSTAGLLEGTGPIRYTGNLTGDEATEALEGGGRVVITDTNRRRLTVVSGFEVDSSRTLAEGEQLDRPTRPLFDAPGSESVAWFDEASTIATGDAERGATGYRPWERPANAFDGDLQTAWVTPRLEDPIGQAVTVTLDEPTEVSSITVTDLRALRPGSLVTEVSLELSDGTTVPVPMGDGTATVDFEPTEISWARVRIAAAEGSLVEGAGLAEVDLGLDLTELVQVPDDLLRVADDDAELAAALAAAPTTYAFQRVVGDGSSAEERVIRRRFRTQDGRTWALTGTIGLATNTADEAIDDLLGGDRGAWATDRYAGELTGHGGLAVDGDPGTGWLSPGRTGEVLTVRFPEQQVTSVVVTALAGPSRSAPASVEVTVGGTPIRGDLVPEAGCDPTEEECTTSARLVVPASVVDELTLSIATIDVSVADLTPLPMEITEVLVNGVANPPRSVTSPFASGCVDLGVVVDGVPVLVEAEARVADLLAGDDVAFSACEPLALDGGWHRLEASRQVPVAGVSLTSPGTGAETPPPSAEDPVLTVVRRGPTDAELRLDAPDGAILSLGESYDQRWHAVVDGEDLGPASSYDTLSGWSVPPTDGEVDVRLEFRPQRIFDAALAVTGATLLLCLALVVRARRSGRRRRRTVP